MGEKIKRIGCRKKLDPSVPQPSLNSWATASPQPQQKIRMYSLDQGNQAKGKGTILNKGRIEYAYSKLIFPASAPSAALRIQAVGLYSPHGDIDNVSTFNGESEHTRRIT